MRRIKALQGVQAANSELLNIWGVGAYIVANTQRVEEEGRGCKLHKSYQIALGAADADQGRLCLRAWHQAEAYDTRLHVQ